MSKAGLLAFCLALATSPAAAVELTYHFEGEIVAARTRFRPTSPFDPLLGRTFTGSFTFDSDDVDTFMPGRSNFYPATRSRFTIDDANFVEFTSFDAPPLIVADNGLFLSADTSETPGHEAVWDFENVDVGESFAGVHLSFFESDVPEAIIEKLNDGTLTENFFTEEGIGSFMRHLSLQVVEQIGPELGDFLIHEIDGNITLLAIPEPGSRLLLAAGLVAFGWRRGRVRSGLCRRQARPVGTDSSPG